jgi:uncharacterized protein (TIGR02996 family)
MAKKKAAGLPSRPEVIAFLRDIKDDPDDDTTRLILADWLEDRFDPRGQFVRLQVTAASLRWRDPRRQELMKQAEVLREQHQENWTGPLGRRMKLSFVRGLIRLTLDQHWLQRKESLALAATETWEWVDGLIVSSIDESGLVHLAESGLFPSISWLLLCKFTEGVSSSGLTTALHSQALSGLRTLSLRDRYDRFPHTDVARIIASSPVLDRLMSLSLGLFDLTPETAIYLSTSPRLGNLRGLHLTRSRDDGSGIGSEGVHAIADSPFLGRLHTLYLLGNGISDAGVQFLSASPHLGHLTTLNLGGNHITDEGVEALCASRHLEGLRHLDLGFNQLGRRGAQALANCSGLSNLQRLYLSYSGLSNEDIRAMVEGSGLPALTDLSVNLQEDDPSLRAAILRRFPESFLSSS